MFATILTAGTLAYMVFLVGLLAFNTLRPQARRSRKLRKRVGWYT